MKVWVFEDNLMWSSRLIRSLRGLGHEAEVQTSVPGEKEGSADAAIVNLGSQSLKAEDLVPALHARGVSVIGHAGHKEKDLLELGRAAGCDILVTNSELTYKIEAILTRVTATGF